MKPLCFVIMPFGKKKDLNDNEIDFDIIYKDLIHPAIEKAGMEPIRADEETVNGIIHKPMYERLILCDYAVADLSTSNANVLYELGIRHAVKPFTTISIYALGGRLPFDVNSIRCMPYTFDVNKGLTNVEKETEALTTQLKRAIKQKTTDSPIYQLVDGISFQNSVAHQKTDIFRDRVNYNEELKQLLSNIRSQEKVAKTIIVQEIDAFVEAKIDLDNEEAGVLIDVLLSYRSQDAYAQMVEFIELLPAHIKNTVMVQEQLGFALNRIGKKDEAIKVLQRVLKENGPSSETFGILGRVYKDKYDQATEAGEEIKAEGFLDLAIETYQKGFEADWRDAYPGTNLIQLLELKGESEKIKELAPVVIYSVQRKIKVQKPEYWDYATLVELAVILNDEAMAKANIGKAFAHVTEKWTLESTMKTLLRLLEHRKKTGGDLQLVAKYAKAFKEEFGEGIEEK